jgi:creatinine amidohydrolase
MPNIKFVHLSKNSRKSIREALIAGTLTTAIIPLGSTEQHNEHLAMEQDSASAQYLSEKIAKKLFPRVIVTPTVSIGSSPHHMHHAGTLSFQPETLALVLKDIVNSLSQHGFKKIVILNGHGGNVRALEKFLETIKPLNHIAFQFISYWDVLDKNFLSSYFDESAIIPGHAGIFETSFALSAFPDNVDMSAEYPKEFSENKNENFKRDKLLFDESRRANKTIGNRCIEYIVDNLSKYIE